MSSGTILSQALEHIPAMLAVFLTIAGSYWILGLVRWPRAGWRDRLLENTSLDPKTLGSFAPGPLAGISLISLFLELLLIRWVASEIRIFAYFKSLVLIACFLGFGTGCYLTRKKVVMLQTMAPLMALVWLVEFPWVSLRRLIFNLSGFIGWFSDVHIWGRAYFAGNALWGAISAAVAVVVVISLFGLIAITFLPLGQLVGRYLEISPKGIQAYSINIFASVIGIWLYTLLCFLSTPPIIWFIFLAVGLEIFFRPHRNIRNLVTAVSLVMVAGFLIGSSRKLWWGEESWKGSQPAIYQLEAGRPETLWSPYQKLTVVPLLKGGEIVRYVLNTNDTWYQEIVDLTPQAVAKHPELYETEPLALQKYNLPYRFVPHPRNALIAGAGMGNDAAAALRNGAGHVTAVEIDPLIYAKGKQIHLEHPYGSDRVEVSVDDARAYVQNAKDKYDLVVFSILDSHTTSSYYTNIRLDNYVYTVEGMRAARNLLKPDGVFVMSFSSERPWFAGKLRKIVTEAFGKPPLMLYRSQYFFVAGLGDTVDKILAGDPELKQFVENRRQEVVFEDAEATTDDWPYLYQPNRGIPSIVLVLSAGLILICWLTFQRLKPPGEGIQWHFFFLGAAFMLMEVQIISKMALLFGTTWLVNSIVITGLLLLILVANFVAGRFGDLPRAAAYAGLFPALAAAYLIPSSSLFFDSVLARGLVAMLLYCSPVFFAGLIFISSFKTAGFRAEAFGSNLLGSLVGGLLESLSFLVGIKALVLLAGGLYLLALATASRKPVLTHQAAAAG